MVAGVTSNRGRTPRDLDELERVAGIQRTEPRAPTLRDAERLERKLLGRSWGRKRKKMEGWPK